MRASKSFHWPGFPRHDLIGSPVDCSNPFEPAWRNWLRVSELPWLRDHKVQGDIVFPAAGMICAVIEALRQQSMSDNGRRRTVLGFQLRDISIRQALVIPNNDMGVEIELRLHPARPGTLDGWFEISFSSCQEGNVFVQNMKGFARIQYKGPDTEINAGKELREETLAYKKR